MDSHPLDTVDIKASKKKIFCVPSRPRLCRPLSIYLARSRSRVVITSSLSLGLWFLIITMSVSQWCGGRALGEDPSARRRRSGREAGPPRSRVRACAAKDDPVTSFVKLLFGAAAVDDPAPAGLKRSAFCSGSGDRRRRLTRLRASDNRGVARPVARHDRHLGSTTRRRYRRCCFSSPAA